MQKNSFQMLYDLIEKGTSSTSIQIQKQVSQDIIKNLQQQPAEFFFHLSLLILDSAIKTSVKKSALFIAYDSINKQENLYWKNVGNQDCIIKNLKDFINQLNQQSVQLIPQLTRLFDLIYYLNPSQNLLRYFSLLSYKTQYYQKLTGYKIINLLSKKFSSLKLKKSEIQVLYKMTINALKKQNQHIKLIGFQTLLYSGKLFRVSISQKKQKLEMFDILKNLIDDKILISDITQVFCNLLLTDIQSIMDVGQKLIKLTQEANKPSVIYLQACTKLWRKIYQFPMIGKMSMIDIGGKELIQLLKIYLFVDNQQLLGGCEDLLWLIQYFIKNQKDNKSIVQLVLNIVQSIRKSPYGQPSYVPLLLSTLMQSSQNKQQIKNILKQKTTYLIDLMRSDNLKVVFRVLFGFSIMIKQQPELLQDYWNIQGALDLFFQHTKNNTMLIKQRSINLLQMMTKQYTKENNPHLFNLMIKIVLHYLDNIERFYSVQLHKKYFSIIKNIINITTYYTQNSKNLVKYLTSNKIIKTKGFNDEQNIKQIIVILTKIIQKNKDDVLDDQAYQRIQKNIMGNHKFNQSAREELFNLLLALLGLQQIKYKIKAMNFISNFLVKTKDITQKIEPFIYNFIDQINICFSIIVQNNKSSQSHYKQTIINFYCSIIKYLNGKEICKEIIDNFPILINFVKTICVDLNSKENLYKKSQQVLILIGKYMWMFKQCGNCMSCSEELALHTQNNQNILNMINFIQQNKLGCTKKVDLKLKTKKREGNKEGFCRRTGQQMRMKRRQDSMPKKE